MRHFHVISSNLATPLSFLWASAAESGQELNQVWQSVAQLLSTTSFLYLRQTDWFWDFGVEQGIGEVFSVPEDAFKKHLCKVSAKGMTNSLTKFILALGRSFCKARIPASVRKPLFSGYKRGFPNIRKHADQ